MVFTRLGLFSTLPTFALLVCYAGDFRGQTGPRKVSGKITESATWSGQILVTGDVIIPEPLTLTLRAGTNVAFAPGTGIVVEGQLLALGSDKEPICLGANREEKSWTGISVHARATEKDSERPRGSRLINCRLTGAVNGITLLGDAREPHHIRQCAISSCEATGVRLLGVRDATVERCQITKCGHPAQGKTPVDQAGAVWVEGSDCCVIRENTIKDCRRYGIVFLESGANTAQANTIESISGKPRSTEGYGISLTNESSCNLILGNRVNGVNYLGFGVANSADNLLLDNEVRNSPDGMAIAGPKSTGNIVRNNRIHGCYWSQLYLTSQCRDNRIENTDIFGGDGAITSWAAGPNTFEGCDFRGTGPIALLGTSNVVLRRCSISTKGPEDLWTEFQPTCSVIDCNFDRKRIGFSKGTTKDSQIMWKHTLTVHVTDARTGKPVRGASVSAASERHADKPSTQTTSSIGLARLEVTEGILKTGGVFTDITPHQIVVMADGYRRETVSGFIVRSATKQEIKLMRLK